MLRQSDGEGAAYTARRALLFLVIFGLVSLFSDIAYEGMRSIVGPYLGILGASAFVVSFVAGFSELIGYVLRFYFGRLADKTGRYWFFAFLGYGLNAIVIPALALSRSWLFAASLVFLERVAKAVRKPSKDTMTSFVGGKLGHGKAFAFDEFLDQFGATAGPLFVAWLIGVSRRSGGQVVDGYRMSFGMLLFPALISVGLLAIARSLFPSPEGFERKGPVNLQRKDLKSDRAFRFFLLATALVAFGFSDFALIGYHAVNAQLVDAGNVPLLYAVAMAVDAVSALILGAWFDKKGLRILLVPLLLSAPYSLFAFARQATWIWIAVVLWGVGLGAQESVFRSAVARLVAKSERASAYGTYNAVFGIAWFTGSAVIGALYGVDLRLLIALSLLSQVVAILILVRSLPYEQSGT